MFFTSGGEILIGFLDQFPSGSLGELMFLGAGGVFVFALILIDSSFGRKTLVGEDKEERLIAEFRSIAAEPVPAKSDPRFKGWDGMKRLSENRPLRWWR